MRNRRREAVALARWRIVETALREGYSAAAREHGRARRTVQRLVGRYQQGGLWALCNQPRGCREPIAAEVKEVIVELKLAQPGRSTEKLRQLLEEAGRPVSRQIVWRVLAERGLARPEEREPLVRFVQAAPNDLWQLDLLEDEKVAFGKVHLVAALDDHSRSCVGARFVPRKRETHILGALAGFLVRWGLPQAILTDRAVSFFGTQEVPSGMTTYQLALSALAIRAAFAALYKPRCKGKIERCFSFLLRDFLAEVRHQVSSLEALNAKLETWLEWYNSRRPHGSLAAGTPGQHCHGSQRAAPPGLESLLAVEVSRRGDRSSTVSFRGLRLAVPPEYLGKKVWLQHLGDQLTVRSNNRIIAKYSVPSL